MKEYLLNDMVRGWFVGGFKPTAYSTTEVEVAVQQFKAGDSEARHFHKIATEITVVVKGRVRMNNIEYTEGAIILISPGESTDFHALEDTITTVVKLPGALNDKYLVEA